VSKCEIMRLSRKRVTIKKLYAINSDCLQEADKAKYLGVLISNGSQWSNQVSAVTRKADGTLGFLRRNLKNAPPTLKETATSVLFAQYLSMVPLCGTHTSIKTYTHWR